MKWGIFDTQDSLWVGNDNGPLIYEDFLLARISAQVTEMAVLGIDTAMRFQAREIFDRVWQKRDDVALKHSPLEAIRRIEGK